MSRFRLFVNYTFSQNTETILFFQSRRNASNPDYDNRNHILSVIYIIVIVIRISFFILLLLLLLLLLMVLFVILSKFPCVSIEVLPKIFQNLHQVRQHREFFLIPLVSDFPD